MPTGKASDLPEKPGPDRLFATPKSTFRTRLLQDFQRAGLISLIRLAAPMLRIRLEKILVDAQSRLPYAYQRWQMEFEDRAPRTLPTAAASQKVAFVYPICAQSSLSELVKRLPSGSLAVFKSSPIVPDLPQARFISTGDEGEFLRRCNELAITEGIEWLVFTHPQAAHDAQLIPALLALDKTTDCVYWDEDHLTPRGKREKPFFKPAWSPELWLSIDLLDTFALRTDCLSRAIPQTSFADFKAWVAGTRQPLHMARVWTHRSLAAASENLARLTLHAESVSAYLVNVGLEDIDIQIDQDGVLKSKWAAQVEKVSIIIPTRNHLNYLQRCLESLLERTKYPDFEIILVDNRSTDAAVLEYYDNLLEQNQNIRLLPYHQAFNFSQACNLGAAAASGSLLLFLNNDVEIIETGWLEEMVRLAQLPGVGIVGARLFYPGGRLQHSGIVVGMTGHANHVGIKGKLWAGSPYGPANVRRDCSAVTAACMLVRSDVFQTIQGFKEDYHLVFNDVEVCLRAVQAGWRVVLTPFANLIHYEGRSRARYIPPEDMRLAYADAESWVRHGDPYYNPNLSLAVTRPVFRSRMEMPALQRMQNLTMVLGGEAE